MIPAHKIYVSAYGSTTAATRDELHHHPTSCGPGAVGWQHRLHGRREGFETVRFLQDSGGLRQIVELSLGLSGGVEEGRSLRRQRLRDRLAAVGPQRQVDDRAVERRVEQRARFRKRERRPYRLMAHVGHPGLDEHGDERLVVDNQYLGQARWLPPPIAALNGKRRAVPQSTGPA